MTSSDALKEVMEFFNTLGADIFAGDFLLMAKWLEAFKSRLQEIVVVGSVNKECAVYFVNGAQQ